MLFLVTTFPLKIGRVRPLHC